MTEKNTKATEQKKYGLNVQEADNSVYFTQFGNDTRLEIKSSALAIGKVLINFQKLKDVNGVKKQEAIIPIYVNVEKMAELVMDYNTGSLKERYKQDVGDETKAKAANQKYYPKALWKTFGGTSAKKLAAQGRARQDGKAEYREITLIRGMKAPWVLIGMVSAGTETKEGLIQPAKDGNNIIDARRIMIPLTAEAMKALILLTNNELVAYRAAQYAKGIAVDTVEELIAQVNEHVDEVGTALVKKLGEAVKLIKGATPVNTNITLAPAAAPTPTIVEEPVADVKKVKVEKVEETDSVDESEFSIDEEDLPFY